MRNRQNRGEVNVDTECSVFFSFLYFATRHLHNKLTAADLSKQRSKSKHETENFHVKNLMPSVFSVAVVVLPFNQPFHYDLLLVVSALCLRPLSHVFLLHITCIITPWKKVEPSWCDKDCKDPAPKHCDRKAYEKKIYPRVEIRGTHLRVLWFHCRVLLVFFALFRWVW